MREYELLLRLLAERVYASDLRDSTDFKEWLERLSVEASNSSTVEEFFKKVDAWE
jgi:hypothetical protein